MKRLRKFVSEKIEKKSNERIASQDEVLTYLTNVLRDKKNNISTKDKIKCAELLCRRYGTFRDNQNIALNANVIVNLVDDVYE